MSLPPPLPGLMPASFRGIGFYAPDVSSEVGRRIAAHYFPGLDIAAYDDHGKQPEKLKIEGFYIGDDYIAHGKALKSAFEKEGTGTLMHPWWGAVRAVIVEQATISYSAQELRMVRVSASFEKAEDNILAKLFGAGGLGTIPKLLSSAANLAAQGQFMLSLASKNTLSRLLSDATMRVGGTLFEAVRSLAPRPAQILGGLLPSAVPAAPAHFGALLANITTTLQDATLETAALSAVAPAAGAILPRALLSADEAFSAAISMATRFTAASASAPSQVDKAILAAAGGIMLASAGSLTADIEPESRKAALALRQTLTESLDAYSNSLQSLFESNLAEGASRLSRASLNVKLTAIQDINETIGRLPATIIIELEGRADAWLIAHMLYGDKPQELEANYRDLISRNNLRHPAMIEAGRLEALP